MARRIRQRSLWAYSIHGRDGRDDVVGYDDFFSALAAEPALSRQTGVGDETVAITYMELRGGTRWVLRFVSGHHGLPPLFYDPVTAQESTADLGSRFVATASWVFVDPVSRMVAAQRDRPGVPIGVIARALSHLGRELNLVPGAVFNLNPVPGPGFLEELDRFERIRQASVSLARPNYNWSDSANQLSGYAADSNAGRVEVTMSAGRGQSLAVDTGIVNDLKQLSAEPVGPLEDMKVTGIREGEARETSVSLAKHQEKQFVPVEESAAPAEVLAALDGAATLLLDRLAGSDPGSDDV